MCMHACVCEREREICWHLRQYLCLHKKTSKTILKTHKVLCIVYSVLCRFYLNVHNDDCLSK